MEVTVHHRGLDDGGNCSAASSIAARLPPSSTHLFITREQQLIGVSGSSSLPSVLECDRPLQKWGIRKEDAGIVDEDPEPIVWGLKQALIDPKLYMFVLLRMALITAQSLNNFFPSMVGTLGCGDTTTLSLTLPPYSFPFIVSLLISFHAAHKHERGWHIAVPRFLLFWELCW